MAGIGKMDGIWELRSIYRWDNESIFLGIIVIYLSLFIWDLSTCTYLSICACPSVCPSVRLFVRPSVLYSMREIIFSREMFHCFFFHPITKDFTHLHTLQTICLWLKTPELQKIGWFRIPNTSYLYFGVLKTTPFFNTFHLHQSQPLIRWSSHFHGQRGISMDIFSGKHTNSYWTWLFIVDLPIENDDFDGSFHIVM